MGTYGDSDIESERMEPHFPTINLPLDESDRNDVHITDANAVISENKGVAAVDANNGNVTNWHQVACDGGIAVTSTADMDPDKRSLVKFISVTTEPLSRGDNETKGVIGSIVGGGVK